MPHFHIPLQSGSDRILKAMQRRYLSSLYQSRVDYIRKVMPDCCIGVDVITGFPGESDADFEESYRFIQNLDVSYLHVFTYSERANTPAAALKDVIPVHIRRERNEMLRILSQKKKKSFADRFLGHERKVLIEQTDDSVMKTGFTDNYIKVRLEDQDNELNGIVNVLLGNYNPSEESSAATCVRQLA